MQNKFLSAKHLADQAIAAGRLDAFFYEMLFYTVRSKPDAETAHIQHTFFALAALILKERYHLFIDEYLQMQQTSLPQVSQSIIDDMESIDLFFEKYYNLLKTRYVEADGANAEFFRQYHRRDLKQDSMLRAFIIARNRLIDQPLVDAPVALSIAYLPGGLTGDEACKACLKAFLTVAGIRKYASLNMQETKDVLQNACEAYRGVDLPSRFLENLPLESLPADANLALKMIEINKEEIRSTPAAYLSQIIWPLG